MIDRWSPILTGAVAEAAWAAVRAIAEDLATDRGEQARAADIALFWAYLAGAVDDAPTAARHEEAVDRLVSVVERGVSSLRLYGGLAGIGWTLAHISEDNEEFLAEVDHILGTCRSGCALRSTSRLRASRRTSEVFPTPDGPTSSTDGSGRRDTRVTRSPSAGSSPTGIGSRRRATRSTHSSATAVTVGNSLASSSPSSSSLPPSSAFGVHSLTHSSPKR